MTMDEFASFALPIVLIILLIVALIDAFIILAREEDL